MPTHLDGSARETLALDTFVKLNRAVDSCSARLARRGALGDLTVSQFGVLESLYRLGPLCQCDLGTNLLRSGSNITFVVDNLEKRGLVQRRRDELDRRLIRVSLTPAGHELIERLLPGHAAAITEELSVLTADEQVILGSLCLKLGRHPILEPAAECDAQGA
jgi:MarR family 2-MHQ and catechol resistance regulon transcriptional repressor